MALGDDFASIVGNNVGKTSVRWLWPSSQQSWRGSHSGGRTICLCRLEAHLSIG